MPDLTKTTEELDPVIAVDQCMEIAARHMAPQMAIWKEAHDAIQAKGYVDDAEGIQVHINRLLGAVEHNVPRDASALWPKRPYIPIEAKNKLQYGEHAKLKAKVVDEQADRGQFFVHATDGLKMAETYGTSFTELPWDVWVENINDREIERDPRTNQIVNFGRQQRKILRDGLGFRARGPWEVFPHPVGNTLDDKIWVGTKDLISVAEVERLIDIGKWKLDDEVTKADLKKGPDGDYQKWMGQWSQDMQPFAGDISGDVGVLCRLYSEGRWLTTWNYKILLQDTENQHTNMTARTKPMAMMRMNTRVGPWRFYGTGLWEKIRDIACLDDDLLSIYIDTLLMQNARWFMYDDQYVDSEDLVAEHGGLIQIKGHGQIDNFDKAVRVLDVPPVDSSLLDVHNLLQEAEDDRKGQHDISRGIAPSPKQTLGASQMLAESAGVRLGFSARYLEMTYMIELAYLATKKCAANMSIIQMVDDGGITFEEATMIKTPDPEDIPGGFNYAFEGSDRVARRKEKHEKLIEGYNLVGNHPFVAEGPGAMYFIQQILESTESFDETQMREIEESMQQKLAAMNAPPPPPEQPPPPEGMPPPGPPPVESVGQQGAIMPPQQIGTPNVNQPPVEGM
jgi:hypothetical protein